MVTCLLAIPSVVFFLTLTVLAAKFNLTDTDGNGYIDKG